MIALLLLSPWLAGLALLFAIMVLVLAIIGERTTRDLSKEASIRQRRGGRFAEDIFQSVDAVEAMGFARHVLARWSKDAQEGAAFVRAAGARGGVTSGAVRGLRIALQVLLLAVAAGLALQGNDLAWRDDRRVHHRSSRPRPRRPGRLRLAGDRRRP
jgi:ABC-type protease/lipase transport system fused ATPase/permease subunit